MPALRSVMRPLRGWCGVFCNVEWERNCDEPFALICLFGGQGKRRCVIGGNAAGCAAGTRAGTRYQSSGIRTASSLAHDTGASTSCAGQKRGRELERAAVPKRHRGAAVTAEAVEPRQGMPVRGAASPCARRGGAASPCAPAGSRAPYIVEQVRLLLFACSPVVCPTQYSLLSHCIRFQGDTT